MENLRGIALMVAAMAGFSFEDMFIKRAAAGLPAGEVLALFGLGGLVVFVIAVRWSGAPLFPPLAWSRAVAVRAVCEVLGRMGYTLAVALTPLSTASAILQATPLVVVFGAAVVFRERVGWRRWTAIGVGFVGVLVILRPGLSGFQPASLFAVLGVLGLAGRDLATRAAPRGLSTLQLGVYGFAVLIPTGLAMLAVTGGAVMPDRVAILDLGAAVAVGVLAYMAVTAAMRVGEVSVVTPFRYSRLLFGIVLGVAVFGERPDAATLIGASIVVASGIYSLWREGRVRRR